MSKSQINKIVITFFDIKGIVHFEFIQHGQKVNKAYYLDILKRLREAVYRKRPKIWSNDWIFHHDNVSAHKAHSVCQAVKRFLAKKSITEMGHPPHSPELDPNDSYFQKSSTRHLKLFHNRSSKNVSNGSNIVGLSA
jgi:hypothetical protein